MLVEVVDEKSREFMNCSCPAFPATGQTVRDGMVLAAGFSVVTKTGGFGAKNVLLRAAQAIRERRFKA